MVSMETDRSHSSPALDVHLGYWLRRVSNQVSGEFRRALQQRGASVAEWVALCQIQEQPNVTPAELAEALAMTRGAVSKVLEKLAAKKWIDRAGMSADKRVQLLSLTAAGAQALPELAAIANRNDQRFFGCLEPGEQAVLRRLLQKLADIHGLASVPVN